MILYKTFPELGMKLEIARQELNLDKSVDIRSFKQYVIEDEVEIGQYPTGEGKKIMSRRLYTEKSYWSNKSSNFKLWEKNEVVYMASVKYTMEKTKVIWTPGDDGCYTRYRKNEFDEYMPIGRTKFTDSLELEIDCHRVPAIQIECPTDLLSSIQVFEKGDELNEIQIKPYDADKVNETESITETVLLTKRKVVVRVQEDSVQDFKGRAIHIKIADPETIGIPSMQGLLENDGDMLDLSEASIRDRLSWSPELELFEDSKNLWLVNGDEAFYQVPSVISTDW